MDSMKRDLNILKEALDICAERRHDLNVRINTWPDFKKARRALDRIEAENERLKHQHAQDVTSRGHDWSCISFKAKTLAMVDAAKELVRVDAEGWNFGNIHWRTAWNTLVQTLDDFEQEG
jgi:hypothetical protein